MSPLEIFAIFGLFYVTIAANTKDDYVWSSKVEVYYKYHTTKKTWGKAKETCEMEGGSLATPRNNAEFLEIYELFPNHKNEFTFVGFHSLFHERDYITTEGIPIQYYYHQWRNGEPNNVAGERCLLITSVGLWDIGCHGSLMFLCEKGGKNASYLQSDPLCCTDDIGYVYSKELKKCYRYHMEPKKWGAAKSVCEANGGHLAIIRNKQEEDFIVNIVNSPSNFVTYAEHKNFVYVGLHDLFNDGKFFSVLNEKIEQVGYSKWDLGQPNAGNNENCVGINSSGSLHDLSCDKTASFICEVFAHDQG